MPSAAPPARSMRLVHFSDLHLGFRQYQRLTPGGINQREADVAKSFQTAIDRVITMRPDLVLVGGDVFHNVRPTNPAIVHAFLQLSRLRAGLPDTPVVIVAGNHDTPRAEIGGKSISGREGASGWKVWSPVSRFRSMSPLPGTPAIRSSYSSPHVFALV